MKYLSEKILVILEKYGLSNCITCYQLANEGNGTSTIVEGTEWRAKDVDLMLEAAEAVKEALK